MTAQIAAHLDARRRVERGEGFVEEEQARLERERPTERHPLRLAAGELRRSKLRRARRARGVPASGIAATPGVAPSRRRGCAGRTRRCRRRSCGRTAVGPGTRRRPIVARGGTNAPASGSSSTSPSSAMRPPSIGMQAGERAQQRRLARAVRSDEHDELAGLDRELDVEIERPSRSRRAQSRPAPRHGATPAPASRRRPKHAAADDHEHDERDREQHEAQHDARRFVVLEREVDRERQRLGLARGSCRRR